MFKTKLDSRKAIEAVAALARQSPGQKIGSKRLLALLYMANRECFKKSGRPLLGGRLVAMKYGPIHGDVYNLIAKKEGSEGLAQWSKHFHTEGFSVKLDRDPGQNALSRFEARILTDVLKKHEDEDDWDIAFQTHGFPEYVHTYKKGQAPRTITLERLIRSLGLSPMETSILRDLKEQQELDQLFENAKPAGKSRKLRVN